MSGSPPITDAPAEAILLAGGARAILLQLANPAVARGVARHSDFAERPLDRLHGTLTYLYVIQYGTPEEIARVARDVGAAHRSVRGADYDARDTDLQLWVAATLYDTAARVFALVYGELSPDDDQSLLDLMAPVATTLGVPRAAWPATPEAFHAYWNSETLTVTDEARFVARELLHPRSGARWMRALMPTVRVVTAGLLSPELRQEFDLPFDGRRFARIVRTVRVLYPRLPRWVRHAPKRHYLARFRRSS